MFFIVGPTAVGKTEIAIEVAERAGAEIVGADAFQVYRGLDILTAKPSPEQLARVPHHLIGSVPVTESFDVEKYRRTALQRIEEIRASGKPALIVGGTGLYVRALTHGLAELPAADYELRARLEAASLDELQARYATLDPRGAERIDMKNRRRLVRAIEVTLLTDTPFSEHRREWDKPPGGVTGALLTRNRDDLYARIDQRVVAMFQAGLLDEVQAAGEVSPTAAQAIGFREARACIAGEMSEAEAIARVQQATRRYAKRQLTWFKREPSLAVSNLSTETHVASLIRLLAEQLFREGRYL